MADADGAAGLEALRRRVYGPDATDADREAYVALLRRTVPPDVPSPPEVDGSADGAAPRRRAAPVVLGAAALAVVVGLAVTATTIARSDGTTPSPTSPAGPIRVAMAEPTVGPLPTRATLPMQRSVIPAQQASSSGSAVLPLLLDDAPRTGTLVVSLSSSDPAPVGWVAERHRAGSYDLGPLEQVAADPPALREGAAAPTVVAYSGGAPSQITVDAPAGIGWRITVAFTG